MLNWPGAKLPAACARPCSASSSSVTVSCVFRTRRRTRYGTGTVGSGISDMDAVDVEKLQARGPQPLPDHARESLEQLVPEPRIRLALPPDARAVEGGRPDRLERPGVARHAVRRHQPRPSKHVAGPH